MKIVLINPPEFRNTESLAPDYMFQTKAFNYPPLGLLYLASNLRGDHDCKIVDADTLGYSIDECLKEIKKYEPDVVGMTTLSAAIYACALLSKNIKELNKDIKIVFGGPHVNIYPEETIKLPSVDYCLTGFAENSFAGLIETLDRGDGADLENIPGLWWKDDGGIHRSNPDHDRSWDINKIKRPNRKLLEAGRYFTVANSRKITTMISSRGCPFSCTFCDVVEKRYKERAIHDIVKELTEIIGLGISQVHFFDDCFNLKRDRAVKMCEAFIGHGLNFEWSFRGRLDPCDEELTRLLYKAGCRRVQIGIEGTDQETVNRIKKNIDISKVGRALRIYKKNKIETMGYFILGFPFQTYEECVVSCKKILKMGFDYINMFVLVPYPNTEIYNELLEKNFMTRDHWREHAMAPQPDFKLPAWHPHTKRDDLMGLLDRYYKKFYLSPRFIFSELRRTDSMHGLIKKVKLTMAMMGKNR